VQVQGTINPTNSTATMVEVDITIPQTAAGAYVLDAQVFDGTGKALDDAQAPFTITASGSGNTGSGNTGGSGSANAVTGTSAMNGTLTFQCIPGGGNVG